MPVLDEPKYPVIDRAPSLTKAVKYFRLEDYLSWAALALPAFPYGYYFAYGTSLAKQHMYFAGGIGVFAGFLYAYQSSFGRLMGLLPNDRELELAGLKKKDNYLDS
eukprot:g7089.t1